MLTPSITRIDVSDPRTGKTYTWTRDKGWSETPQLSLVTNLFTGQIDPNASISYIIVYVYLSGDPSADRADVYCKVSEAGTTLYEGTVSVSRTGLLTSRTIAFRGSFVPRSEGEHRLNIYVETEGNSDSVSVTIYAYRLKVFTVVPSGLNVTNLNTGETWFYNAWTGQWYKGQQISTAPSIPAGHRLRLTAAVEVYTDFPCTFYVYLKDSSGNILCQNSKSTSIYHDTVTCDATITMPSNNLTVVIEGVATSTEKGTTRNSKSVTIPVSVPPPTYTPTPAKVVRIDVTPSKTVANVNESIDIVYTIVLDMSLQPGETIDADHYIEINGVKKQITPIFLGSANNLWSYKTSVSFSSPGTYAIRIGILYRGVKRG